MLKGKEYQPADFFTIIFLHYFNFMQKQRCEHVLEGLENSCVTDKEHANYRFFGQER